MQQLDLQVQMKVGGHVMTPAITVRFDSLVLFVDNQPVSFGKCIFVDEKDLWLALNVHRF